jgi:hypothetical protein
MSKVFLVLKLLSFYLFFILCGITISGYLPRVYSVLQPEDAVFLKGETIKAADLAAEYAPEFYVNPAFAQAPLQEVGFEVLDTAGQLNIIYRPQWADEFHPQTLKDIAYRSFRFLYYGLSTKDIEYIQLSIDKETGAVNQLQFESAAEGKNYNSPRQQHLVTTYEQRDNNVWRVVEDKAGKQLIDEPVPMRDIRPADLRFTSTTWNHLLALTPTTTAKARKQEYSLTSFDADAFKSLKIARRSQGDIATRESKASIWIVFLVNLIPLGLFSLIIIDYEKHGRKDPLEYEKATKKQETASA